MVHSRGNTILMVFGAVATSSEVVLKDINIMCNVVHLNITKVN